MNRWFGSQLKNSKILCISDKRTVMACYDLSGRYTLSVPSGFLMIATLRVESLLSHSISRI